MLGRYQLDCFSPLFFTKIVARCRKAPWTFNPSVFPCLCVSTPTTSDNCYDACQVFFRHCSAALCSQRRLMLPPSSLRGAQRRGSPETQSRQKPLDCHAALAMTTHASTPVTARSAATRQSRNAQPVENHWIGVCLSAIAYPLNRKPYTVYRAPCTVHPAPSLPSVRCW